MSILVTGGTKGIGLDIARRFATPGNMVFLNFREDQEAAKGAKADIVAAGAECFLIAGDVGTPEGANQVVEEVARHTQQLDQLVHCAVKVVSGPLLDMAGDELERAINLNGTALAYLARAAKPLFVRGSTVFFLSSKGGRTTLANYASVGAGKALGEALIRYLALELAPLGVRANSVAPSAVATDALRQVYGDKIEDIMTKSAQANPSGRNVESEDYCSLIEFLASPAASMIQGQLIFVNGGAYLAA